MALADTTLNLSPEVWATLQGLKAQEAEWIQPDGEYGLTVKTFAYYDHLKGFALRAWIGNKAEGKSHTIVVGVREGALRVETWGDLNLQPDTAPSFDERPEDAMIEGEMAGGHPEERVSEAMRNIRHSLNHFYVLNHPRPKTVYDHIEEG